MDKISEFQQNIKSFGTKITDVFISAGYITGLFLGIAGLVLVIIELTKFYKVNQISKWPISKNIATITDTYFETYNSTENMNFVVYNNSNSHSYYRTRILFKYNIRGEDYIGLRYSYYEPWSDNPISAKSIENSFKIGSEVDLYINPSNPSEAYIVNYPYNNFNQLVIGTMLLIIGIYTLISSKK